MSGEQDAAGASCPCGSGATYGECCGPLHSGSAIAGTAEQLMRSRFSAFAVGDAGYLRRTWHRSTRPARLDLDDALTWTRLDIVDTVAGREGDDTGIVEFRAHYRAGKRGAVLHERSTFVREGGQWRYVTGEVGR